MCSPVEGPMRTETSHFLIKSLELKCHVHIFLLFVLLCSNTLDACLFVAMNFIYIYVYIYMFVGCVVYIYIYIYIYSGYCIGTRKAGDLGSTPSECLIFYLFRCVHSSMQPLRSVGRSNFDKGRHNLTTLIQKSTYINESCYIIYIYIYI